LSGFEIIGIDADIAYAIGDKLGLRIELVDMAGKNVDAELLAGRVDIVMGLEPDAKTYYQAHTVGPYLVDGPAVFAVRRTQDTKPFALTDLTGARIGAQEKSVSANKVTELVGAANITTFPLPRALEAAFNALAAGTVSYVAADAITGSFLAIDYKDVACVGLLGTPLGVYIGVAPANREFATVLSNAVTELRVQGTLKVVVTKWLGSFSTGVVASDQAITGINTAGSSNHPVDNGSDLPDPSLASGSL
jgi:polar amino acid transport system substrate-binding protein